MIMKILIIGSKGFIGYHLYSHLVKQGHEIWSADVIIDNSSNERYFHLDATNSDFSPLFNHTAYELCINCSGAASVPDSIRYPFRDYSLNTLNVFKILEAIRRSQSACKFLNLSSAAVYGNPERLPINEDVPVNPLSPYGIHKLQAEQICKEFNDFYKIQTCSVRIFSVYGPGLRKQLFWDLYNKIDSGIPFTLFGTGNESRDFIYISDLVKAIEIVYEHSDFCGNIINIANGMEIRIKDAVSIFTGFFNTEIKYTFSHEIRKGDPTNWRADISKLQSLGYMPQVDIIKGLSNYFEWIKTNYINRISG